MSKYWKTKTKKDKKKKVISSKIDERLDKFGRVSRFVNQSGSVPSTDTEMFGCEIVRDLPDYVNNFVKQIGYDVVIRVPKTNPNVLTGSGEKNECHTNSNMLSISFGGNRILGLQIQIIKSSNNSLTIMSSHSVWNTPENNTRCVTYYGEDSDYESEFDIPNTLLFIPIGMNNIDRHKEFMVRTYNITDDGYCFVYNHNKIDRRQVFRNPKPFLVMKKDLERRLEKKGHIFPRVMKVRWSSPLEEIITSNFGEVSSTTGRSWDYFRNKILKTYYPGVG
jgi:hypothetical protein